MTNYLVCLAATATLLAGTCPAAETPAAKPATAAKPAAGAPAGAAAVAHYVQIPGNGRLDFYFMQGGAENHGSFRQFDTELAWDERNPAAGSLKVTVQIGSLDTQDQDRNDSLRSADLFDAQKFPTAQYSAASFSKGADGRLWANGKLTLRGVTRDLRIPLDVRKSADGVELSGETRLKRLDYGVGQGEWKSTEMAGDEVRLQYKVGLKAK